MSCPQVDRDAGLETDTSASPVVVPVVEPTYYILPDTLHSWPYKRIISSHYTEAENEAREWFWAHIPVSSASLRKTFEETGIDDYTDDCDIESARAVCEATMDAIRHPEKPRPVGEHVFGEMARQFWERASANAPQATKERFVRAWRKYLDSVILQASHRHSRRICTAEEYMISRRNNIGIYPCYALLEMSLGVDIPHHITEHPTIAALSRDAADMVTLSNDMFSYKKETLANSADYNAVTIVMHHNKTDVSGGIQWIADRHDELVERFLKLRNEVNNKNEFPSFGDEIDRQVEAYVHGIGQWVRGHYEWMFGCTRYLGEDGLEIQRSRKVVIA